MRCLLALFLLITLVLPFSGCEAPTTTTTETYTGEITGVIPSEKTETSENTQAISPVPKAGGKSFIWKISSGYTYVYLLGSVHVADPDTYPLEASIENAYKEADKLVVEVNINEVSELKATLLLLKYGSYPEGESLRDNLPADLYDRLQEEFKALGVSLAVLESYRPWAIMITMEALAMQEAGYTEEYGIDLHFINRAIDSGMEVVELETAEYQFEMLSSIPDETMIRLLLLGIEDPFDIEDLDLIFQAWEEGDAAGMEEATLQALVEDPALAPYYDILFTQRNYNMLAKIEEFLADDDVYFIVVGAGHLVGDEGLLNLLEERGYTLEQLGD